MIDKTFIEEWCAKKGCKYRFYSANPKAVIFGEAHEAVQHAKEQNEMAELLGSDLMIHELMRNYIFDVIERKLFVSPECPIPREAVKDVGKRYGEGEFVGMTMDEFEDWISVNGIQNSLPLCEAEPFSFSFVGNGGSVGYVIRNLPSKVKLFAGCDMSEAEQRMYERKHGVELCSKNCPKEHHAFRERRFADAISRYAGKTEKPLIVTVGAKHISLKSAIHSGLKESRLDYVCINQIVE